MNASGRTIKKLSLALAATAFIAGSAYAQQASLVLTGSTLTYCNTSENTWEVKKEADKTVTWAGDTPITWNVTVTKNGSATAVPQPDAIICAEGDLTIYNGGAGAASLGNIVVNLQKNVKLSGKNRWVSAAANVADATLGDGATTANIVATSSQEDPAWNAAAGTNNYLVSAPKGTFSETSGISGTLEFTDTVGNTAWSLSPSFSLAGGATVTLKYKATFVNKVFGPGNSVIGGMQIADLSQLRTEVLVTFGNAGARGGSGATASGFDIDGNLANNDGNVRTVPIRLTSNVPALVECNDSVVISDTITTTGNVESSNIGAAPTSMTESGTFTFSTLITGGTGSISNTVDLVGTLNSEDDACCKTAEDSSSVTVEVIEPPCQPGQCVPPPPPCEVTGTCPPEGTFCTYTQGGWGAKPNGNNPAMLLKNNFAAAFGSGVVVGTGYTMTFTTSDAVKNYLPAGGTAGSLTSSLVNPTSSSAGVFGGQVTALTLSLGMSGVGTPSGLGAVTVNTDLGPMTLSQILAIAASALGGGDAGGFSMGQLNELVTNLNEGFDNCVTSGWMRANLVGSGN